MFSSDIMTIVHGCNAKGRMKSGVAKTVRALYPQAYTDYRRAFIKGFGVGDVVWTVTEDRIIANAITQNGYAEWDYKKRCHKKGVFVSYEGLRQAMRHINAVVGSSEGDKRLCLPLIGAGLAGGSWSIISKIIEEETTGTIPVVYTLDGIVPGI
jgi:O-acetyl-ADP-ribose deacetylase (regulator of RNase III)